MIPDLNHLWETGFHAVILRSMVTLKVTLSGNSSKPEPDGISGNGCFRTTERTMNCT